MLGKSSQTSRHSKVEPPADRGSAPETILFIHGLGYDRHIWDGVIERLGENYYPVSYDLPGHGERGDRDVTLTWDLLCQDLLAVIESTGSRCCHLVGHEFGAVLAMKAAFRFPERVRSLTLISAQLYFPKDLFLFDFSGRLELIEADRETFIEDMIPRQIYTPDEKNRAIIEGGLRRVASKAYRSGIELVFKEETAMIKALPHLKMPVLFVGGDRSPVLPPHLIALFAAAVPKSGLQIIPNAASAVFLDQPELFTAALTEFYRTHDSFQYSKTREFLMEKVRTALEEVYWATIATPSLEVRVIGDFSVRWNKRPVVGNWDRRLAKELLAFLTLTPTVSREHLIDVFFPDASLKNAKNYLRVMISHLKTIFEDHDPALRGVLQVTRSTVHLNCEVQCDLKDFLSNLKQGFGEERPLLERKANLINLLFIYKRGLMDGFRAPWVFDLLKKIEDTLANTLVDLVRELEAAGLYDEAIQLLKIAQPVEVYDGYCDEKIAELREKKQDRQRDAFTPNL
ncbi:alpha/beta hydrolase [Caenibacillus caldisaponilyticus]|uniref:alpha/beta hydrolase n=1 Tax=Caenibacillus caldisaponilyticus TaxID=1674942 RepID=UPI0009884DFD|nr:alpha/beta hydrolase [Caenibacillus caldisaponilyticus]